MYKCICGKEFINKQSYCGHCSRCKVKRGDDWKPIKLSKEKLDYIRSSPHRLIVDRVHKDNPLSYFNYINYDDNMKDIISKNISFIDRDSLLISIREFISKYDDDYYTKKCKLNFLRKLRDYDAIFSLYVSSMVNDYSTWDIANKIGVHQSTIRRLCDYLDIEIPKHNSSKVHMRMKPYIEEALGFKTESEFYINVEGNKYFIDEYCDELKLCIEIDGSWCHSEERDNKKDSDLNKIGLKVIRIPSDTNLDDLVDYIKSRL